MKRRGDENFIKWIGRIAILELREVKPKSLVGHGMDGFII